MFVDNSTGWEDQAVAELTVPRFPFSPDALHHFIREARGWLDTPIHQLGTTFFSGEWRFGAGSSYALNMAFGPFRDTPSKTDWFTVRIYLTAGNLHWNENLHIDYTGLKGFVQGLMEEGFAL